MNEKDWLAEPVEENRTRLRAVAYRIRLREVLRCEPCAVRSARRPTGSTLRSPAAYARTAKSGRVRQAEERLLAGSSWNASGYVFTTTIGTPLEGINVTRRFQRILKNAGLPR